MFFKKKDKKDESISLDNFQLTPDDKKIKEIVIDEKSKKNEDLTLEDSYKHRIPPRKKVNSSIEINYDEKFKDDSEVTHSTEYVPTEPSSIQYRLAKYIVLEHTKEKVINKNTTLGNILAGDKYSNWQIQEILGKEYALTREDEQYLLSKAVSYCNLENITVSPKNVQTKGKLKTSKEFINKLKMFSKDELNIIFQLN